MFQKLLKKPFLLCVGLGFILNMIIELCSRAEPLTVFNHIVNQPLAFLFNWGFAVLALSVSLFFKRKYFVISMVSVVWIGMAIGNLCVIIQKKTPVAPGDFLVIQVSWDFIGKYISPFALVIILAAAVGFILAAVLLFRKSPQAGSKTGDSAVKFLVLALAVVLLITDLFGIGIEKEHLSYFKDACEEYGYVYCFLRSTFERGIDEPEPEELEDLEEVIDEIEETDEPVGKPAFTPNIIMLQLESFFDVNLLEDVTYSENPIPFYTELRESNSHGKLSVPSIGAGTANTEFEVLTQMNYDFFGTGEYPYYSVLKERSVESVPFDLKELGYNTFAIHSNNATFYDRNIVFSYMGFDRFISKEYMVSYEETVTGWVKDEVLFGEIFSCLESTENQDFIYTITVQGHGAYLKEKDPASKIKAYAPTMTEEEEAKIEYYINQLHDTDDFLKVLISTLENYEEPTMVVLFGDHMPPLDIDTDELMFGDLFETEYVIWANFETEHIEEDLEAFQLSSHAMEMAGVENGLLTELHLTYSGDPDYLQILETAQYDMIEEDIDATDTEDKYVPSDLKLGLDTVIDGIEIMTAVYQNEMLAVKGKNFTTASKIFINGREQDTVRVSRNTLRCDREPEPGDIITVVQVSDDGVELSATNEIIWE